MASPQPDKFYRYSRELHIAFIKAKLPGLEQCVWNFIFIKTFGWGKKKDHIPLSQFCEFLGLDRGHICQILKRLELRNMIARKRVSGGTIYGIQKNYDLWISSEPQHTLARAKKGSELKLNKDVSLNGHSIETLSIEKNTIENIYCRDAKIIIKYLNEITGKKFSTLTKKYIGHITARLKEKYTVNDLKQVINNKAADPYFAKNPRYMNPDTLFGSQAKVDKYLNEDAPNVIKPKENRPLTDEELMNWGTK